MKLRSSENIKEDKIGKVLISRMGLEEKVYPSGKMPIKQKNDFIKNLFDAGMNVARLNTAHIEIEDAAEIVKNLRSVSDRIGILIDTKGPEVRIRDLETPLEVTAGEVLSVSADQQPERGFCVNYDAFVKEVPVGSDLLIDDGEIHLTVEEKQDDVLLCKVTNSGEIKNRKSVFVYYI